MNGGPSIIGIRASEEPTSFDDQHESAGEPLPFEPSPDFDVPLGRWRSIAAVALVIFALAWVGGAVWAGWQAGDHLPLTFLPLLVAAGAIGPLLAAVGWLLTQRTSSAEAQRFGRTAQAMRAEARALEQSVAVLGEAIAQHRVGLAEQVRSLTQLGDAATARLGEIGRGLSEEIDQADVHARALTTATEAARDRLAALLGTLPRAEEETRALTSAIDAATLRTAEGAVALDAQIAAVTARGREAEQVAGSAAEKLAAHIQRMEATSDAAAARLEAVTSSAAGAVDALLDRTAVAIDESRKGIAAQGDAMLAMVATNQHALDSAARESAEALAERISIIEQVIERIATTLDRQRGVGDALLGGLDSGIATADARLAALHASGVERTQHLAGSISALAGSAEAMTAALDAGDLVAQGAIATTERLLTAYDAAAREIDETLPDALARLDTRVAASQRVVAAAKPELLALVTAAESTHDAIEAIAGVVAEQRRNVDMLTATLLEALTSGRGQADEIGAQLDEATTRAHRFAEDAAPRLLEALLRVRETATAAADHARETLASVIPEAAGALERQSAAALERVTQTGVETQIALIADLAQTAVRAADSAGARLEDRLRAIDTAAASIDDRLADARAAQDEREGESFARRASLLIEALNSASIDLTRSLAPEVADSAWAAYLKGDRGVFTRRAVRLIDSGAQRDLARLYDDDAAFREQVNRYIHDFEAMLRTILAQRDGSPLGVTLLSSDMGKLYVALAQAIERLR